MVMSGVRDVSGWWAKRDAQDGIQIYTGPAIRRENDALFTGDIVQCGEGSNRTPIVTVVKVTNAFAEGTHFSVPQADLCWISRPSGREPCQVGDYFWVTNGYYCGSTSDAWLVVDRTRIDPDRVRF